jgi:hypothetical protein
MVGGLCDSVFFLFILFIYLFFLDFVGCFGLCFGDLCVCFFFGGESVSLMIIG